MLYRNGGGVWLEPGRDADGGRFLCVDDDYVVTTVCEQVSGEFFTRQSYATVTDGDETVVGLCGQSGVPEPELIKISGAMTGPGGVWVAGRGVINSASGWMFEIMSTPGSHAVLVTNNYFGAASGQFLIQRADFLADTDLGTFDLVAKGRAAAQRSLEVANVDALDQLETEVWLYLDDEPARFSLGIGTVAHVVPTDSLLADDRQEVEAIAYSEDGMKRFVRIGSTYGTGGSFEMPPRLTGVEYGETGRTATWSELPESFTAIQLYTTGEINEQLVVMSKRYMDRFGLSELGLTAVPDFAAEWLPAEPLRQVFNVIDETSEIRYQTAVITTHPANSAQSMQRFVSRGLRDTRPSEHALAR